jgi:hypothetical protein
MAVLFFVDSANLRSIKSARVYNLTLVPNKKICHSQIIKQTRSVRSFKVHWHEILLFWYFNHTFELHIGKSEILPKTI